MKVLLPLFLSIWLWSQGGCADVCEVLTYDRSSVDVSSPRPLGEGSNLYIYTTINITSNCSGNLNVVRFCYAYKQRDEDDDAAKTEIVRVLLWKKNSMTIEAEIPIVVNSTTHCKPDYGIRDSSHRLCCVERPINHSCLTLQAVKGKQLDFLLGLQVPESLGDSIILPTTSHGEPPAVCGYVIPGPLSVGSELPQTEMPRSQELGLISFISRSAHRIIPKSGPSTTATNSTTTFSPSDSDANETSSTINTTDLDQETEEQAGAVKYYYIIGLAVLGAISLILAIISCILTVVVIVLCRYRKKSTGFVRNEQGYSQLGRQRDSSTAVSATNQVTDGYSTLERNRISNRPNQYEEIDAFSTPNPYVLLPAGMDSMCMNPMYVQNKRKNEAKTKKI